MVQQPPPGPPATPPPGPPAGPPPGPPAAPPGAPVGPPTGGENTSGQGPTAVVPPELQGWCWGGFLLNWIWAAVHKAWLGFALSFFLGIIGAIFCGVKGNEWAWQNNRYESVAHFREIQAKWTKWGVIILIASCLLSIIGVILQFILVAALSASQGMQSY